jgi:hypothetical protein
MRFEKIDTKPAPLVFPNNPPKLPPARRACKDCLYHSSGYSHYCHRPELLEWSDVHGYGDSYPAHNRKAGGACGPEGKYWQADNVSHGGSWWPTWLTAFGIGLALIVAFYAQHHH